MNIFERAKDWIECVGWKYNGVGPEAYCICSALEMMAESDEEEVSAQKLMFRRGISVCVSRTKKQALTLLEKLSHEAP